MDMNAALGQVWSGGHTRGVQGFKNLMSLKVGMDKRKKYTL